MDTYEFEFPGGSATIFTDAGGTKESPDFYVRRGQGPPRYPLDQPMNTASVFAAEILKLAERTRDLEHNLVVAGEARENTEIRLSGQIAELEATLLDSGQRYGRQIQELGEEVNSRGAQIVALEEETKDLRFVLRQIFALNPEMGAAEVARLQARVESLRDRVREEMEKNASIRADLVSLRIDLSVAVKDGQRLEAENRLLEEENAKLKGEIAGLEQESEGNAGHLRQCEILEAERAVLRDRVTTLEQEAAHLEAENSRLRLSDARLTSLRLEVEVLKLENRNLRTDLAAAIKTGEEQGARLAAIQRSANEALTERGGPRWNLGAETGVEALIETIAKLDHDIAALEDGRKLTQKEHQYLGRLSRLDALLSSEAVPAGLFDATDAWPGWQRGEVLTAAWRWFRGQLGAPASE